MHASIVKNVKYLVEGIQWPEGCQHRVDSCAGDNLALCKFCQPQKVVHQTLFLQKICISFVHIAVLAPLNAHGSVAQAELKIT
jgi:hypothetical protein